MKLKQFIQDNKKFTLSVIIATIIFFTGVFFVTLDGVRSKEKAKDLETIISVGKYNALFQDVFTDIDSIETYIDIEGVDQLTEDSFSNFVANYDFNHDAFVSFSIAPDGIVQYYYSEYDQTGLIGRNLIDDERFHVRNSVNYAINKGVVVVDGPFELLLGDQGVVFRKPLFNDDNEFTAIINYVVDYKLLSESFDSFDSASIHSSVYDENNQLVFGDTPYSNNFHYYQGIDLNYVNWSIGIVVTDEYEQQENMQSILTGIGFLLLYTVVMYLWYKYYTKTKKLLKTQNKLIKYDNLTDLPNRILLNEDTTKLVEEGIPFYLGFGDLDNFKNINDVLGHSIGDQYLSFVASKFTELVSESVKVYRWGGDEFIFVFIERDKSQVITKLDQIFDVFKTPFDINGSKHQISISIGLVEYPKDGHSIDELIKRADIVMYDIKSHYKNTYSFFKEKYLNQLYQEIEFQQRLDNYTVFDFEVFLQPIVDIDTNEIKGFEGLSRLFDKDGFLIPTFSVIKRYEQDGKITGLDKHVFHQICEHIIKINKHCTGDYFVSFNISPLSLSNDFIEYITRTVNSYDINPQMIVIEIIETLGFKDVKISVELLNKIKKIGFKIAMDDFGMGYSSLSYIAKLPLDIIKIDRSFVSTYETDPFNETILRTIQDISESLHLDTLVEGIETEKQLQYVKELGTKYYQGYLHSKPQSIDSIIDLIKRTD